MQELPGVGNQSPQLGDATSKKTRRPLVGLDKNENPFEMPQVVKDEILNRVRLVPWARYPPESPDRLIEKLAKFNDWNPHGILVGNGADELLRLLLDITVDSTTRILVVEPTLDSFPHLTGSINASVLTVPLTETLQFNVPRLCSRAVAMKTEIILISSPHNPSGCLMAESDLVMLLKTSPGIVIIDEAYYEFARLSAAHLLKHFPQLVILRSFSIALGMAGLGVGYLMGAPTIVEELRRAFLPGHLDILSTIAAEVAIERFGHFRALIEKIISERERLYRELRQLEGVYPVPSHAHFMMIRTGLPGQVLCERLREKGILVLDLSRSPLMFNFVRITVGTPQENDRLLEAFRELFRP